MSARVSVFARVSVCECVLRTVYVLYFFLLSFSRFQFWFLGEYAKISSRSTEGQSNKKSEKGRNLRINFSFRIHMILNLQVGRLRKIDHEIFMVQRKSHLSSPSKTQFYQ